MRWEYNKLEFGWGDEDVIEPEALKESGEQGWELISVVASPHTSTLIFYFKRPLPEGT